MVSSVTYNVQFLDISIILSLSGQIIFNLLETFSNDIEFKSALLVPLLLKKSIGLTEFVYIVLTPFIDIPEPLLRIPPKIFPVSVS